MRLHNQFLTIFLFILNSCVAWNERDCVSVTYNYYRFSKVVAKDNKVIKNTGFTNNWSNERFTKINSNTKIANSYVELGAPHVIITRKISNYGKNKKTSYATCLVYSRPCDEKIPFNLYALVFVDDQECIKVSCELLSFDWMKDLENILLHSDSLHYYQLRRHPAFQQKSLNGFGS